MKCASCHLESERTDIFRVTKRFAKPKETFCLPCFEKLEHRKGRLLFWSSLILGILFLPFVLYGPTHTMGYLFLSFATFEFFLLVATLIHELGHAVAGRIAGLREFGIEIGKGRIVYDFLFVGLHWRLRAIPVSGRAYGSPRHADFFKLRMSLFIIGGPLANVADLSLGIKLLQLDKYFEGTVLYGYAPVLVFTLANIGLLPFSLWPYESKSGGSKMQNDALLLWQVLRCDKATIEESPSFRYLREAQECQWKKDLVTAQKWIDEGLHKLPKSAPLKFLAAANLSLQKRYAEASRRYALLIGRDKRASNLDVLLLNNIAFNSLLIGKPQFLRRADTCSRLVLERMPLVAHHKGTRGSVLVELGHYHEGMSLLYSAMKLHPEKGEQALNACYLGIAEARQGNLVESRNYFNIARRLDPDCVLLSRESSIEGLSPALAPNTV